MTLLELCEPLFLKVCELNRMARLGQHPDYLEVHSDMKGLLEEIQQKASATGKLAAQARKLELPLTFFVDSILSTSKLRFADQWRDNRLAKEKHNELAGDDRFFDMLDETLKDPTDEASERLAVFYVCLGLGFVGGLAGQAEALKGRVTSLLPMVKHLMDVEMKGKLCAEAYNSVDTRRLIEPPASRMVLVAIIFLCLALCVLAVYYGIYAQATDELNDAIDEITQHEGKAR
jgi:type IV/VI secretion system ImpK/VasF family protein